VDISTVIGLVAGTGFILFGIFYGGGTVAGFLDPASVAIVMGGTFSALLVNHPLTSVKESMKVVRRAFTVSKEDSSELINSLVGFAVRARREGLLALESETAAATDEFLKKGLNLVVDGTDPDLVRSILETDLAYLEERHRVGAKFFEDGAVYAPAMGLVGTLIGLILMLATLDNPDTIGSKMAIALLTTFYGSVMANLIFLPICGKLKLRSADEVLRREIMIEGILAIQAGEGPSIIQEKLNSFLAPSLRARKGSGRED
jgi:chemotaxis protein MotA